MRWKAVSVLGLGLAAGTLAFLGRSPSHAAELVVSAGPRTPEEEAKAFHLPPGFEAQLVAAEPEIHKPINMAFDERGRLWVTNTVVYPFPAKPGTETPDSVKILEDFGPDGHARKITTFADNLNIPVGVLPLGGNEAIVYSIPAIYDMKDTTGSGHADVRKPIITGQAHDDTHGQTGSFTEGFDGWIYAVHGFRNTSDLHGTDGSELTMNSGNTYRFQRDGSHLQQFTHGQVNPFGMALDPLGNVFTSDCETKPMCLLLRGSYYPSFGKPDDGLGFGPDMVDHMYGSTAIAGLVEYVAEQYPAEYRGMMLVGNVVTNKINRAQLVPQGSAYHGEDRPDFLVSDDHWFRPTCIKLGPDGALYVADFYNRIIGHYEVDLHHPGRDKERGRIWRIVYKGTDAKPAPAKPFDLTKESTPEQIASLSDPNFTIRMLGTNYLADHGGQAIVAPLKQALASSPSPLLKIHGMWVLKRLGALDDAMLKAYATDADRDVRVHAMRVLSETLPWSEQQRALALAGLKDADPMVQRCAADAMGQHPALENVRPLLDAREHAPNTDKHLVHMIRIALRNQLNVPGVAEQLPAPGSSEQDVHDLVDVAVGSTSPGAAMLVIKHLPVNAAKADTLAQYVRHAARYGTDAQSEELAKVVSTKFANNNAVELLLFKAMEEGIAQRNGKMGESARQWAAKLAAQLLNSPEDEFAGWTNTPVAEAPDAKNPWSVEIRPSADGDRAEPFISSRVLGEQGTGVLRSKDFILPARLSFFIAGHSGPPSVKHTMKNVIRLRASDTHEVLATAPAPRNDTAQRVEWDLSKYAGRRGYIEATDADTASAYAWLAFGRFEPAIVPMPISAQRPLRTAIEIAGNLHLTDLTGPISKILSDRQADPENRTAAAVALGSLGAQTHEKELSAALADGTAPNALRNAAGAALAQVQTPEAQAALVEAIRTAPNRLQLSLSESLAASQGGAEALLNAVEQGKASPRLLLNGTLRERLNVSKPANLDQRIEKLTAHLPAMDISVQRLIDSHVAQFNRRKSKASPERGAKVFATNCQVCHSIGGQGARIGPQLDGAGVRGPARLAEDILDPSRNVDAAFRQITFVLDNGDVVAGIPRREEGETLTIADSTGKEIALQKSRIKRQVVSNLSLMPSNFGEIIKQDDFDDLLSYLLTK